MSVLNQHFPGRPRVLLPVVHCVEEGQVHEAVDAAFQGRADGVWLINQGGMHALDVLALARRVRAETCRFVGVNVLGVSGTTALASVAELETVDGLWVDDAGVVAERAGTLRALRAFQRERVRRRWTGLYFGGVAFKYRPEVPADAYAQVAYEAALGGVDVVTTSGDATGTPPPVEKVEAMARAIYPLPLAVASGVTPDNVGDYLPHVRAFLVATGVERAFGVLDVAKVRDLADKVHAA